jgi:hypothetical protein
LKTCAKRSIMVKQIGSTLFLDLISFQMSLRNIKMRFLSLKTKLEDK